MEIIVKRYEHFNRAMGKHISSKAQYDNEMRKGGYVTWEEGERLVKKAKDAQNKPYLMSNDAKDLIKHAKSIKNSKGEVKLGERAIKKMEKLGMSFKTPDQLKKLGIDINKPQGGFK